MTSFFWIYDDNIPKQPQRSFGKSKPDPNKAWARHYDNLMHLSFIAQREGIDGRPALTFMEKRRLEIELGICYTKLEYWQRLPDWDSEVAARTATELKNKWQLSAASPKPLLGQQSPSKQASPFARSGRR